ncbi:copper homeostasis protein CutC [Phyllobacterium phragmitis]|uniref:PF03932 family protein CutC n=1 Tax=Phyllobacterium phragmitis TaxID=2670329 RepID=A0A2S9IX61_9HYPH|nr:copper homeostasis protein CutC [Phyllobacterium phragmitis]PRD45109.1 copper homeostasis protein CutC [Phyllobacterium phragmitis]
MSHILLEVCVDDAEGLEAAIEGGADRIELCSALQLGGLTPSPGLIVTAAQATIPVYAMIRPRAGDFIYTQREIDQMLREIDAVRATGLAGVVFGASKPDGSLDDHVLDRLKRHATGLGTTLHRAFDLVPDIDEAVRIAFHTGFERILTSGRAPTALEGLDDLERTFAAADGNIAIMPGSGLTADNVGTLLARLPITELHASCSTALPPPDGNIIRMGFDDGLRRGTDRHRVGALKQKLV